MTTVMEVPVLDQTAFDRSVLATEGPVLVLWGDG